MKLALFDLDNTLLPIDSDYAWGEFSQQIGWTDPVSFKARNDQFYADYQSGVLDIHEYVRFATDAVRLKGPEQAEMAHRQFMNEIILPAVKPSAMALVKQHQAAGDHVMIVTATNEFVTRPIAQAFGVSELIAVELERDAHGALTGETQRCTKMNPAEEAPRKLGHVEAFAHDSSINRKAQPPESELHHNPCRIILHCHAGVSAAGVWSIVSPATTSSAGRTAPDWTICNSTARCSGVSA